MISRERPASLHGSLAECFGRVLLVFFFCFMARHALVCQDAWANTAIFRRTGEGNFSLRGTFWEERLIFTRLIFLLNQEDMGSQRRLMWLPVPNGTAAPNTGKKKKKSKKKHTAQCEQRRKIHLLFFFPSKPPKTSKHAKNVPVQSK